MKKALSRSIAVILSVMLFIGNLTFSVSAVMTVYNITDLSGKYKTQGRTTLKDDLLLLDWSASGIEFTAECSGEVKKFLSRTCCELPSHVIGRKELENHPSNLLDS